MLGFVFVLLCVACIGEGQILRTNGANGLTVAAFVVRAVSAVIAGIEVEAPRVARVFIRVERRRPVVAVLSSVAKTRTAAIPGRGQEYGAAGITGLLTCHLVTVDTILGSPCPRAVVYQLLELSLCGHAPAAAPLHAGYVITQLKGGLVVNSSSVTLGIVLGEHDVVV